jgi:hypothetical protein
MTRHGDVEVEITPEVLLKAYACGIFPMAESADDPSLYWIDPQRRGVIPLDGFHVPRRLARTVRSGRFEVRIDHDFEAVIDACSIAAPGRDKSVDQPAHPPPLQRIAPARALPLGRDVARREARGRALRRATRARLLRREHVPP